MYTYNANNSNVILNKAIIFFYVTVIMLELVHVCIKIFNAMCNLNPHTY